MSETSKTPTPLASGKHFIAVDVGPWNELHTYTIQHPKLKRPAPGKVFLNEPLKLTGMELSLNKFPAGVSMPFHHKHRKHEEVYLFVRGRGQFQIDGETFNVQEGTAIRVAPDADRTWRNNSTEDLYFIVIQANANSLENTTIEDGIAVDRPVEWPK